MCGIAGMVRFDDRPIERGRLSAMLAHIRHRGPDGEGVLHLPHCSLAHARLSIIDLSGGAQPMSSGGLHVVFNGEIYNHRALRRELRLLGHTFRTDHSDTEVLLHGYRQWGAAMAQRLEGMFAFALWDAEQRSLMLARDRMGKKPLYVRRNDWGIAFASLAATLVEPGAVPGAVDADAMRMFLRLGYTGRQSLLAGVEELPPAHWMIASADGRVRVERYWQAGQETPRAPLREVVEAAVEARLESDVPLGCFLSGGIDSSVVAALAQQLLVQRGGRLRTFSVRMPVAAFDESAHARTVADHIGAEHTQLDAVASPAIVEDLERLIAITGEPTADSSILPTHWLSRATREHVKVALSGDGGDELFGGYDRYRAMLWLENNAWWARQFPPALLRSGQPRSWRTRIGRVVEAARQDDPARRYMSMIHLFSDEQIRDLGLDASTDKYAPAPDYPGDPRLWDLDHYLPMDLLRKVDRAAMAVALEVRCPLLDSRVVNWAAARSTRHLMPAGRPKAMLRELAATLVPPAIAGRPKRGFAIPVGQWFRESLRDVLADQLMDGSLQSLGLRAEPVRRFYDEHQRHEADHTHRLFALLELSLWVKWLKGRP